MADTTDFLNADDEQAIIAAIQQAEKNTSGEIRIHIENESEKPPLERAQEVFHVLGMDATTARNGVLFYIGINTRTFAIIGDEGIDKAVESDFWDCTKDVVLSHFKENRIKEGLVEGILRAGDRLKQYFPFSDDDKNELPDTISRG
ncbi:TPM domain-containing protein [Flavobacterium zepuense]|uniref:TPM domain-containing protein n=1 Tax=Flavobacterium zepuense TaxID=2593302 RepID=A0A552V3Z0_9FLAO|nr:TPM domain-containing protein [Flavobacterium zepuense]TRW25190.1 TPM domain-containing protein [Flavobacterium zepuense]